MCSLCTVCQSPLVVGVSALHAGSLAYLPKVIVIPGVPGCSVPVGSGAIASPLFLASCLSLSPNQALGAHAPTVLAQDWHLSSPAFVSLTFCLLFALPVTVQGHTLETRRVLPLLSHPPNIGHRVSPLLPPPGPAVLL